MSERQFYGDPPVREVRPGGAVVMTLNVYQRPKRLQYRLKRRAAGAKRRNRRKGSL